MSIPRRIADVLANATEISTMGKREPMSPALRSWLGRALQIDYRQSFHSAIEAQSALEALLSDESGYIAAPIALETFLARYQDRALERTAARSAGTRAGADAGVRLRPAACRPAAVHSRRLNRRILRPRCAIRTRLKPSACSRRSLWRRHRLCRAVSPLPTRTRSKGSRVRRKAIVVFR